MGGFIAGPIAVEIYRVADRAIMTETIETSCVRCQATICLLHLQGTAAWSKKGAGNTSVKVARWAGCVSITVGHASVHASELRVPQGIFYTHLGASTASPLAGPGS